MQSINLWFQLLTHFLYRKMAGALAKAGLYIDELSKVRVLEPEVAHETSELKEECRDFVESKY
jgi:hypothetical protein